MTVDRLTRGDATTRLGFRPIRTALSVCAVSALAACSALDDGDKVASDAIPPSLEPISFDSLPGWTTGKQAGALAALRTSCAVLPTEPSASASRYPDQIVPRHHIKRVCDTVGAIAPDDHAAARSFLEQRFSAYAVAADGAETGLFTGYYEAEVRGSRTPTGVYRYPIYRRPPELVMVDLGQFRPSLAGKRIAGSVENGRLVPYAERAEIDAGALRGRGLELFWLDDPTDAFMIQVQGSGQVLMPDGARARVGYDGQNGHVYKSIGRELVRRGALTVEEATLPGIRAWVRQNPREMDALFAVNQSYVFFREVPGSGAKGAQGVVLTPRRSIAVDRRYYPLGLPFWLDLPFDGSPTGTIRNLVIAQDTGGAIKGAVRGDYFWGFGKEAEARAGVMRSRGRWFVLVPKGSRPKGVED